MSAELPDYVLDPSPLSMFTRLQRVGLHLERLQAEAMDMVGMTFADYTIIATLHREPAPHALPVSRLAELVLRPMGSITQVIDRLERAGMVSRQFDADDRRRVLIGLTPAGISVAETGDEAYRVSRERVLDQLEPTALAEIDAAVFALLDVLEQDQHAPVR